MKEFFVTTVYTPLYNVFVGIIDLTPTYEVFWAAIIFTVLIKLILSPLAKSAMVSQIKIKGIQSELKALQVKYKDQRDVLAPKMMALYKDNKINPLSPVLVLLVQIPIILSLFFIFKSGLPQIDGAILYSFISNPGTVEMVSFGIDLAARSLPLAILTGITQYLYTKRTFAQQSPLAPSDKKSDKPEFGAEFQKMITFQFTYVMPIIIIFIAYSFASVLALYWTTSNIFAYLQDVYIRRQVTNKVETTDITPEIVPAK